MGQIVILWGGTVGTSYVVTVRIVYKVSAVLRLWEPAGVLSETVYCSLGDFSVQALAMREYCEPILMI